MFKKWLALLVLALFIVTSAFLQSCKSCNKPKTDEVVVDTTAVAPSSGPGLSPVSAPRGDTALMPVLSKVLEGAFALSQKKDYAALASLIVYRGPEEHRYGTDVFTIKNSYEKKIVKTTSDVFNKWNKDVESLDYMRVFELPQPDGRPLPVIEVLFVSRKGVNRKFFGFLLINNEYKIADVTSIL